MKLILGLDPGSHITGYGLVREIAGNLRCEAFGILQAIDGSKNLSDRLLTIGKGLEEILRSYKPDSAAVEKTFFAKNADSTTKLGHARGVCLYELAKAKVKIFEYSPTEVKRSLVGSGRAGKDQVQFMVQALLGLPPMSPFDMSDALALAIHHARIATTQEKLKQLEIQN